MQVSQSEKSKIVRRVGVQEEYIKFRPSPNFKNMKKFLKSRSDYSETTTLANPKIFVAPIVEAQPPACEQAEIKEKKPVVPPPHVVAAPAKLAAVQPPLPPYPPPESPPLNVTIKQEKLDEEELANSEAEGPTTQDVSISENQTIAPEQNQARPKKTICKEYIRGNCKRPVCKYAHEVDVSQLDGVYTFCWNFQNDVCKFPNCRFVHASVFEEAEFYRTGVLPAHARQHLKKQQTAPQEKPQPQQPEIRPVNFANPPPAATLLAGVEQRTEEDFRTTLPRVISPLKRERSEMEEFSTSPRDLEPNEHMAKKCKNCEIMEISVNYNKNMFENMIESSDEINKKIGLLNKKKNKLYGVLLTLFKHAASNKLPVSNGLLTGGDKDQLMIDQLKSFVGSNHRLSGMINDDSLKNIVGGNVTLPSLVAKLIRGGGDPALPLDSSRET